MSRKLDHNYQTGLHAFVEVEAMEMLKHSPENMPRDWRDTPGHGFIYLWGLLFYHFKKFADASGNDADVEKFSLRDEKSPSHTRKIIDNYLMIFYRLPGEQEIMVDEFSATHMVHLLGGNICGFQFFINKLSPSLMNVRIPRKREHRDVADERKEVSLPKEIRFFLRVDTEEHQDFRDSTFFANERESFIEKKKNSLSSPNLKTDKHALDGYETEEKLLEKIRSLKEFEEGYQETSFIKETGYASPVTAFQYMHENWTTTSINTELIREARRELREQDKKLKNFRIEAPSLLGIFEVSEVQGQRVRK